MLVILPPSETKSDGGSGGPLDLSSLSFPGLTPVRRRIADALVGLAADVDASRTALGLGRTQLAEIDRNADLWQAPTRPAIERYTGVAYDALDVGSLTRAGRPKAMARLAIGSALFGVVRAGDPIPAYRLSGDSRLPGLPTLRSLWRPDLMATLADLDDVVVDLRSGSYRQLGPVSGAITATVMTEGPGGSRKVVSHFNKHYKGLIARDLVRTRRTVRDVDAMAGVLADAGRHVEVVAPDEIVVLTD